MNKGGPLCCQNEASMHNHNLTLLGFDNFEEILSHISASTVTPPAHNKEWMNERMNQWINEWMNEWKNKWINKWMNGWMTKWMNECDSSSLVMYCNSYIGWN